MPNYRRRAGFNGRLFTAKDTRAAYSNKARQLVDGRWWFAPGEAAGYIGKSLITLRDWRRRCPFLGGQGLEVRRLSTGYGRILNYYAKDDLDRVNAAMARLMPFPKVPGHAPIEDALAAVGGNLNTLYRRIKAKRVMVKKIAGKSSDIRARPRSYVPEWFVDEIKREQTTDKRPADRITVRMAMERLGRSKSYVHSLIDKGLLKRYSVMVECKGAGRRQGILLSRAEVERLANPDTITRTSPAAATKKQPMAEVEPQKRTRGRPSGVGLKVRDKRTAIREDINSGRFGPSEIARRHHVSAGYVRNVRNGVY